MLKLESDWSGLGLQPFTVGDHVLQCILWCHWLFSQKGSFRKHEEALILNIQVRCRTSWRTAHGAKFQILQYDSLMHCYLGTNRPFDTEPHEGRAQDPLRICVVEVILSCSQTHVHTGGQGSCTVWPWVLPHACHPGTCCFKKRMWAGRGAFYLQTCCPDAQFYPQNSSRLGNWMLRIETDQACKQGFPDSSVGKECTCNAGDPSSRRDRLPTPVSLGVPCGSAGKESACNAGDLGLIPGLGRSPGEGKGYPLQYSGLENSMDCMEWGPWGQKE